MSESLFCHLILNKRNHCSSLQVFSLFHFPKAAFIFSGDLLGCVCVCMRVCVRAHVFGLSVVSNSLWPYGLQSAKFLCSWNFPGKNNEVCCHFLLQVIFFSSNVGDKGIKSTSPASLVLVVWFFTTESHGNPHWSMYSNLYCLLSQTFSICHPIFLGLSNQVDHLPSAKSTHAV